MLRLSLLQADDEDRARGVTDHAVRDAAEDERRDRAVPSRADGDQSGVDLPCVRADPLDGIPRRESRPDAHTGGFRLVRRSEEHALGVAPLGLEEVVKHGGRRVGEAVVAL